MNNDVKEEDIIIQSSGNVFFDIGLPNPEEELEKAKLRYKREYGEKKGYVEPDLVK